MTASSSALRSSADGPGRDDLAVAASSGACRRWSPGQVTDVADALNLCASSVVVFLHVHVNRLRRRLEARW